MPSVRPAFHAQRPPDKARPAPHGHQEGPWLAGSGQQAEQSGLCGGPWEPAGAGVRASLLLKGLPGGGGREFSKAFLLFRNHGSDGFLSKNKKKIVLRARGAGSDERSVNLSFFGWDPVQYLL